MNYLKALLSLFLSMAPKLIDYFTKNGAKGLGDLKFSDVLDEVHLTEIARHVADIEAESALSNTAALSIKDDPVNSS